MIRMHLPYLPLSLSICQEKCRRLLEWSFRPMAVTKIIQVLRNDFISLAEHKKMRRLFHGCGKICIIHGVYFPLNYVLRLRMKISRRKRQRRLYKCCGAGCGWLHSLVWESQKGVNYYQNSYCWLQMKKIILSAIGFF